jgi:hypothetical protein
MLWLMFKLFKGNRITEVELNIGGQNNENQHTYNKYFKDIYLFPTLFGYW